MLYLAEVQKQKSGFGLGGSKAELKLLARQQGEHSWIAEPRDSVVPADEANSFNPGALVLVELSANKQVQRIQEAAAKLVSILQNFSQAHDKFKNKEEEIQQWQESLTYMSQELNRREMEMQAREEQLEMMQEQIEQYEPKLQELEALREESYRLQEDVSRGQQELEAAWEQLRAQTQQLDERQVQMSEGAVLDETQSHLLQEQFNRLSETLPTVEGVRELVNQSWDKLNAQQALLTQHWEQLAPQKVEAERLQVELEQKLQDIQGRWSEWQQAQQVLEQNRGQLQERQGGLKTKQQEVEVLKAQIQGLNELHQRLHQLTASSDQVSVGVSVDVAALEAMSIEELQGVVQSLQEELERFFRFVNDQEEELTMQRQTIEELQAKIQTVSEYDRLSLENELAEEQESYRMLNETLVGQRRTLREREEVKTVHEAVLWRRLGTAEANQSSDRIDLTPILQQLEQQRDQLSETLRHLEAEISELEQVIHETTGTVNQQIGEQQAKWNEIKHLEQGWREQMTTTAGLWGRVRLYEEILQPVQEQLNELRSQLEGVVNGLTQMQEAGDHQVQVMTQLRETLMGLLGAQAQLAS